MEIRLQGGHFTGYCYCRYCGRRHFGTQNHAAEQISPLQREQIKFEDLEYLITRIHLTGPQRLKIGQSLDALREAKGVPRPPIYISEDPRRSPRASLMSEERLAVQVAEYENVIRRAPIKSAESKQVVETIILFLYEIPMTAEMQSELNRQLEFLK